METDRIIPDTESLIRHIGCMRDYLNEAWGVPRDAAKVDFSPDNFGHSRFLPETDGFGGIPYYCRALSEALGASMLPADDGIARPVSEGAGACFELSHYAVPNPERVYAVDHPGREVWLQRLDDASAAYWDHHYICCLLEADVPSMGHAVYALRSSVFFEQRIMRFTVKKTLSLEAGAEVLRHQLEVDWHEISRAQDWNSPLSFRLPLCYRADALPCDIPGG